MKLPLTRGLLVSLTALLAVLAQPAHAACYISPLHTIISEGDSTVLTVQCDDALPFDTVDWKKDGVSVIGGAMAITLSTPTTSRQYTYRTPATLVEGSYVYKMTGVKDSNPTESSEARVVVRGGLNQTLTVNKSPGAGGTVTQMTTGAPIIDCGATCSASPARNSTLTLVATPNAGYDFAGWSGDCAGTGTCTLTMSANRTVTASFTAQPVVASCGAANAQVYHQTDFDALANTTLCSGGGSATSKVSTATAHRWSCGTASCQAARGYNVTSSVGAQADGTMTPTGTHLVQAGRTKRYTLAANTNFGVSMSGTCGGSLSGTTAYTTNAITQDCTVIANFPPPVTVTATDNGSANGDITPASRDVPPGQTTTFTVTPNTGYSAAASGCGGSLSGTTYTTGVITTACTVTATFTNTTPSYTVTYTKAGVTSGGTISKTSESVQQGGTGSVLITPSTGYNVSASGCSGSPTTTQSAAYTYTTGSIVGNCTVTITFTAQGSSPSTDPGIGSNQLWIPPTAIASPLSASNLVVADHSGGPSYPPMTYIPGCLNGEGASTYSTGCAANTSYTGTPAGLSESYTVTLDLNKVLSLRYRANATITNARSIKLSSSDGSSNLGRSMSLWITTDPTTSYEAAATACKATADQNLYVYTGTGGIYCPLTANGVYYVNVRGNTSCSNCRYKVDGTQDDFQ